MASAVARSGVPPLGEFLERVRSAEYARYAARPGSKVADEAAFAEMKAYLLSRYQGIDPGQVRRSFVDGSGSVFDCIPLGQQPALRDSPPATRAAPDLPRPSTGMRGLGGPPEIKAAPGDAACPSGTIPLQRVMLETLTNFGSLREFFRK